MDNLLLEMVVFGKKKAMLSGKSDPSPILGGGILKTCKQTCAHGARQHTFGSTHICCKNNQLSDVHTKTCLCGNWSFDYINIQYTLYNIQHTKISGVQNFGYIIPKSGHGS